MISKADPDNHDSISYNKYFADLAKISNTILEDERENNFRLEVHKKDLRNKLFAQINELGSSKVKDNLFQLLNIYF